MTQCPQKSHGNQLLLPVAYGAASSHSKSELWKCTPKTSRKHRISSVTHSHTCNLFFMYAHGNNQLRDIADCPTLLLSRLAPLKFDSYPLARSRKYNPYIRITPNGIHSVLLQSPRLTIASLPSLDSPRADTMHFQSQRKAAQLPSRNSNVDLSLHQISKGLQTTYYVPVLNLD